MTTKRDQMDWRRTKVLELSSQGHSEREIASALQIGKTTVHQDLTFLNKQAQETLQHHIHTVVPFEYQKCVTGMRHNLKQTLELLIFMFFFLINIVAFIIPSLIFFILLLFFSIYQIIWQCGGKCSGSTFFIYFTVIIII